MRKGSIAGLRLSAHSSIRSTYIQNLAMLKPIAPICRPQMQHRFRKGTILGRLLVLPKCHEVATIHAAGKVSCHIQMIGFALNVSSGILMQ